MDKIYGYYNHQASSQFCSKDYFEEYSTLLQSSICYKRDQSTEEKMFQLMGVELSKARLDLMSHYCRYFMTNKIKIYRAKIKK